MNGRIINDMQTKEYTNYYIAYIDLLGFKEMVKNSSCDYIYDVFINGMHLPMNEFKHYNKSVIDMNKVKYKVMSDSICFFVDSRLPNSLVALIATCVYFQVDLLRRETPVLTRGAIVKGDLFYDDQFIYGPGFVDAYLLESKNAKYPRIIMTKETIESAIETTKQSELDYIPMMTFTDFDEFYTLDCCKLLKGLDKYNYDLSHLLSYVEIELGRSVDSSIREKLIYLKKWLCRYNNTN